MFESFYLFKDNMEKLGFEPRSCLLFDLMGKSTIVSSKLCQNFVEGMKS